MAGAKMTDEELMSHDASGMLGVLDAFPEQVSEALEIGMSDVALPDASGITDVTILGMGGSGISGDVASVLAPLYGARIPVLASKQYSAPAYLGPGSLVFAVSYSGNTAETLAGFAEARDRGARVVAVSSGGALSERCGVEGVPLFGIPGGLQPRASLGYLFVPIICALERMGLLSNAMRDLRGSLPVLESRRAQYSIASGIDDNPARRLARDLIGFLPVVYGVEGYLAVAALRWKCQFNEMAKIPAFHNYFPELNHNETVGWQNLREICSQAHVIALCEPGLPERLEKRIEVTLDLIGGSVAHTTRVFARGSNTIERLLDVFYFGDYASVYTALELGQDPTPVERIDELKKRLAG